MRALFYFLLAITYLLLCLLLFITNNKYVIEIFKIRDSKFIIIKVFLIYLISKLLLQILFSKVDISPSKIMQTKIMQNFYLYSFLSKNLKMKIYQLSQNK